MSALEAIEDRLLDLEAEKRILDARIEELERLRGEIAIEGDDVEDVPEIEAVIVKPAKPRAAIAAPKAEPVAKGGPSVAKRILAVLAERGQVSAKDLFGLIDASKASIYQALTAETQAGRLERIGFGRYGITAAGRAAVPGKA